MMERTIGRLVHLLWLGVAPLAVADDINPLLVELRELQPGVFSVRQQVPPELPSFYQPQVRMPKGCEEASPSSNVDPSRASKIYRCSGELRGKSLSISYPGPNPSMHTALRIRFANGAQLATMMGPEERRWDIPGAETWTLVARRYAALGATHILQSMDHLFFVICLLWVARTWPRVLTTITGFTVAHSVTLVLSALGVIGVPSAPLETSIALSGRQDTWTWRYPVVVASGFGLLHGLGFASALSQIGLPQTELVVGLLFFNIGVELGQIAFIVFILGLQRSFRLLQIEWPRLVAQVPIYTIGVLSAWWTMRGVERIVG